jgi:integrase
MRELIRDQMGQPDSQPEFVNFPAAAPTDKPVTFASILDVWKLQNKNAKTGRKFTSIMDELAAFIGHDDANRVTPQNIVAFKESLQKAVDPKTGKAAYHPNTVSNKISAIAAVFRHAKREFKIDVNPMADVKIPGKVKTDKIPYTVEQVRLILTEGQKAVADIRWPTLIQAFTGCRVAEIVDCHTSDVEQVDGIWQLHIREDNREEGQTTKTESSVRTVVLNPEIIRQGFIDYVQSLPPGPLFPHLPLNIDNKRAAHATNKIGKWMRGDLGITNPKIQPNHSFRSYVASQLLKAGVDVRIRDMILGHGANVARKYEHAEIVQMAEAIAKLPNPLG